MIGYYVHHQGHGHLARASSICAHLCEPVTVLSSLSIADTEHFDTVRLPRDDGGPTASDPTAHGTLHWVPLHDSGLRERMAMIAEWVSAQQPDVMVVDVSVEVAMLVRLLGVPVVVTAMPGERIDRPHELIYQVADHIVAPWPRELYEPRWLREHSGKTTYAGGISRFDGRPPTGSAPGARTNVLVLSGAGGSRVTAAAVTECAAAHPEFEWVALGGDGAPWTDDPWPALCTADVVISSAGQGSVADIAAAGRPAIIIPAERPFAEQHTMARVLDRAGLAVVAPDWPAPTDWPALIDRACALGHGGWQRWNTRGAAARAAAAIESVAADHAVAGIS